MWKDATAGAKEGLGTRRLELEGVEGEECTNILRRRTDLTKLSKELRIVVSEELGGEQMNDRPRERTSCSVSVSILELKL